MEIVRRKNFRFSEWAPEGGTPDSGDTDSEGTETHILGIISSQLHNESFSAVMKTYATHKQSPGCPHPLQMRLRHCPPISALTTPYASAPPPYLLCRLQFLCSCGALKICLQHHPQPPYA
ncbi:hypothetical protein O181_039611 [Austropuccinia psidii MF-1]|uniref:Uncharacterized protein n=1 Tax=Austropuccinia psidii MF-1 TaxID=1389203 RepID=A0A9Q3DG89_9BASI|nr:hypothetical protein [Austropuccinia psidii MF-1]